MRRGVGIDGKGWRSGGRGKRSHNNDVVLFSHSHTLLACTIESGLARNNCQALRCDAGCDLNNMLMHAYCVEVTI